MNTLHMSANKTQIMSMVWQIQLVMSQVKKKKKLDGMG